MKKRGQISLFLILGIAILIIAGIVIYMYASGAKSKSSAAKQEIIEQGSADIVKKYAESCLKMAAERALFDRIGLQGGYINISPEPQYMEEGIKNTQTNPTNTINPTNTSYLGKRTPYYLEAICASYCAVPLSCTGTVCTCTNTRCSWSYKKFIPDTSADLELISYTLARYVEAEFEKCFNRNAFNEIGIEIIAGGKPSAKADLNEEDVSVKVNYNLTVEEESVSEELNIFEVTLPIRLKALYKSSLKLLENIERITDTEHLAEVPYNILPDCPGYNKNGLTNVYSKTSDSGAKEVLQLVDFSTYNDYYSNSFIFQFGLKRVNVIGACAG